MAVRGKPVKHRRQGGVVRPFATERELSEPTPCCDCGKQLLDWGWHLAGGKVACLDCAQTRLYARYPIPNDRESAHSLSAVPA